MKDERPFAFAGLWDHWADVDGRVIESCTLLTTTPNELLAAIHNRMPVILNPDRYDDWLDPGQQNTTRLFDLVQSYPAEEMEANPVSRLVNNARFDDPRCIETLVE